MFCSCLLGEKAKCGGVCIESTEIYCWDTKQCNPELSIQVENDRDFLAHVASGGKMASDAVQTPFGACTHSHSPRCYPREMSLSAGLINLGLVMVITMEGAQKRADLHLTSLQ